ncbi:MAG: AsnC family transcriptional regulator [Deltaproteobacteria bacterium]|nr:AsnC family transcriptional regulator [Deltaproteobacteria bacterium]
MSRVELDIIDKRILLALQGDLDNSPEPYAEIALDLSIPESEVIDRIKKMFQDGIIRRIGAMIRHIEAGIGSNGMVVWKVEPERTEEVGAMLAGFPEVTHCYERPPFGRNGGTLFTMVHSASKEGCLDTIKRMSETVGVSEYEVLFSERELKKVSMTYFDETL